MVDLALVFKKHHGTHFNAQTHWDPLSFEYLTLSSLYSNGHVYKYICLRDSKLIHFVSLCF